MQNTNQASYDDVCEEVKKLKAEVLTLKENVTKMASELEKIKASENTIVEVITDEESEEEVESIVAEEKKDKNQGHKPVDEAFSDKVVVHSENENMSLEDIIRENSWFMCEKCEYKSKTKKSLKIHTIKTHSEGYKEGKNVAARASLDKSKCNICGFITFIRDITNHIREEHEDYLEDGLLRPSVVYDEIYFNT